MIFGEITAHKLERHMTPFSLAVGNVQINYLPTTNIFLGLLGSDRVYSPFLYLQFTEISLNKEMDPHSISLLAFI